MLDQAYECFPCFLRDVITLRTNQLDTRDGRYVDITPAIWDNVIDSLETAEVTRRTLPDGQLAPSQVDIQDSSYALHNFYSAEVESAYQDQRQNHHQSH
jgi:hypothetical protein